MLFFDITLKKLIIFDSKLRKIWDVVVPGGVVRHMEVVDEEAYGLWWSEVVKQLPLTNKEGIVLLEEDLSFFKVVADVQQANDFWAEVPLEERQIEKKQVKLVGKMLAVAVDRRIFAIPVEILAKHKMKILAVTTGFGLAVARPTSGWGWKELSGVEKLVRLKLVNNWMGKVTEVDTKKKEDSENEEVKSDKKVKVSKLAWVEMAIIPILLIGLGLKMRENFEKEKVILAPKAPVEITVTPSVTLAPSPTTMVEEPVAVADIRVLVLNASGITGEAGRMKEYLESLGYVNVDTGNATKSAESGIIVASRLGNEQKQKRIVSDLKLNYPQAEIGEVVDGIEEHDVLVKIGL